MKIIIGAVMTKKEILIESLKESGLNNPVVRWIPNNPMGRRHGKTTGWVYREYEDKFWQKLGDNFEAAKLNAKELR
jgi:hypothetical protein